MLGPGRAVALASRPRATAGRGGRRAGLHLRQRGLRVGAGAGRLHVAGTVTSLIGGGRQQRPVGLVSAVDAPVRVRCPGPIALKLASALRGGPLAVAGSRTGRALAGFCGVSTPRSYVAGGQARAFAHASAGSAGSAGAREALRSDEPGAHKLPPSKSLRVMKQECAFLAWLSLYL